MMIPRQAAHSTPKTVILLCVGLLTLLVSLFATPAEAGERLGSQLHSSLTSPAPAGGEGSGGSAARAEAQGNELSSSGAVRPERQASSELLVEVPPSAIVTIAVLTVLVVVLLLVFAVWMRGRARIEAAEGSDEPGGIEDTEAGSGQASGGDPSQR